MANKLGIRRASVTKQLIWLEQHGIITRETNPEDKRMIDVKITEKGMVLLRAALPAYWKTCTGFAAKLSDADVSIMIHLLLKTEI